RSTARQSSYVSGKRWWVSIAKTRAFGSTPKSSSSRTLSSFWKEHASATLPGNCSTQKRSTSSALIASTSGGSCSFVAKQHLLQRVAAQAEPQRLERDDLLGGNVPEVHVRPAVLHAPRLRALRRSLPHEIVEVDRVLDLLDQACAHVTVGAEDPGRAAFARLGDHLPRAGVLLFLDPLDPLVGREHDFRVLRADFGEHGEVPGEVGDQLELALAGDFDRPVGDLDVREPELLQPPLVLVELAAQVDDLEERAADHDTLLLEHVELPLQVVRDVRGSPPELDDVDVLAGHLENVLP